jgi:hypothetical protein
MGQVSASVISPLRRALIASDTLIALSFEATSARHLRDAARAPARARAPSRVPHRPRLGTSSAIPAAVDSAVHETMIIALGTGSLLTLNRPFETVLVGDLQVVDVSLQKALNRGTLKVVFADEKVLRSPRKSH